MQRDLHPDPAPDSLQDSALPTRPSSLWPESALPGSARAGDGQLSSFDALQAQAEAGKRPAPPQLALCRPALTLRVLVFVQAVVLVAGLPLASGWTDALLRAGGPATAALAGSLPWLAGVCALQASLRRLPGRVALLAVAGLGALSAVLGWAMSALLGTTSLAAWPALAAALCGASLATLVWTWLGLRAAAERPADAKARLAELQSRIRPHFLFNALNSALALVQIDTERAERVLEDLSELFRTALVETGSAVTLDDEIDLAQRYLAIEKVRFAERIEVLWDLDPAADLAMVPPLVLQPLVENAVRHGVEPDSRGGRITVRTRARRGVVEIEVINTLPEEPSQPGSGMALGNVRERLRLLHDLAASLDTGVQDGRYHARITVPL